MYITPLNSANTFTGVKVVIPCSGENKKVTYMYNYVSDLVKEHQVPATFYSDRIELSPYQKQEATVLETIKNLGLSFKKVVDKI